MSRPIRDISVAVLLLSLGILLLFSSFDRSKGWHFVGVVYSVFKPIDQTVSLLQNKVGEIFHTYLWLIGVSEENRFLNEEVRRLRTEIVDLKEKEYENKRLRKILLLKSKLDYPTLVAQIIGEDASGLFRTVLINKGTNDGVFPDMPVTVPEGIVGKINRSSGSMAQVVMITDPSMSVDCRVVRTRDRGLLTGTYSYSCLLKYLNKDVMLNKGDLIVTSGLDGIFPGGLVAGTVEAVRLSEHGLFREAVVTPGAKFSEIEEVVVILGTQAGFALEPGLEGKP